MVCIDFGLGSKVLNIFIFDPMVYTYVKHLLSLKHRVVQSDHRSNSLENARTFLFDCKRAAPLGSFSILAKQRTKVRSVRLKYF